MGEATPGRAQRRVPGGGEFYQVGWALQGLNKLFFGFVQKSVVGIFLLVLSQSVSSQTIMNLTISYATLDDLSYLKQDSTIRIEIMKSKINNGELIIAKNKNTYMGSLRFGFFWDSIPFLNNISIEKEYRRQGIGTKIVTFWEEAMKEKDHKRTMTSTQANEDAQHFYRKLGYYDIGSICELNDGPLEIILIKNF